MSFNLALNDNFLFLPRSPYSLFRSTGYSGPQVLPYIPDDRSATIFALRS